MTSPLPSVDVVVLGGGPGGYSAALRAAGHGLSVAIVEADSLGGTCLHRGCIPSKALLHVAHVADQLRVAPALGFDVAVPAPALDRVHAFRDGIVRTLHQGLEGLLRARAVNIIRGRGRVVDAGEVAVEGSDGTTTVRARHVVVATGSSPAVMNGFRVDGVHVLDSDAALRLARVPSRAAVIGAGAVGVEFASLWRSLGAEVVLIEAADTILPLEDPAVAAVLRRALERRGIEIRASTHVAGMSQAGHGVILNVDDDELPVEQVLVAIGRRPTTAGAGLAELGVLDDRGYVDVDAYGRSPVDNVWAVGDVVPTLALAHAAFAEGFVVADAIAGESPVPVDHALVPRVTYCNPEVASVGLTETQARERHGDVVVTVQPLGGNARALVEQSEGAVKLVTTPLGEVVGVHIVGPMATELVAQAASVTAWGTFADEAAAVVTAHPTLAEALREAYLAAAGRPFHRS